MIAKNVVVGANGLCPKERGKMNFTMLETPEQKANRLNEQLSSIMNTLTPRKIVEALDKYIIGQHEAKKCVAIAIRNRWRRQQLSPELRDEVLPKNIIMIGPTGVGKTEIARRLASMGHAPFIKVEATRYTEVGYHGRDVESMVRDLVEFSINMVKMEWMKEVGKKAEKYAEEGILDLLLPGSHNKEKESEEKEKRVRTREKFREKLHNGELAHRMVEIKIEEKFVPMMQIMTGQGMEELGMDLQNMFNSMLSGKNKVKKVTVEEAKQILEAQEAEKLIDKEKLTKEALWRAENLGLIFIDEIDKIAGSEKTHGPDVSREGVQRDLLPIVEGSTVFTRYGLVNTDHILFIASGAFHVSKPSDLIPELQGRFPLRVELSSLNKNDFIRILTEPKNALIKQYKELLKTEKVELDFKEDAIDEIAEIAFKVNESTQNIGARRLQTVMEKLVEDISFEAPDKPDVTIIIDKEYVRQKLQNIVENEDLSRYVL